MFNPHVTTSGHAVGGISAAADAAARYAAMSRTPAWLSAPAPPETPEERDARLAVQREALASRARADAERAESDRVTMGALARSIARLEQQLAERESAARQAGERATSVRSRFGRVRRARPTAPPPTQDTETPAREFVDGGRAVWQFRRTDGETHSWRGVEFLEMDTRVDLEGRCSVDESRVQIGMSDLALSRSQVEAVKSYLAERHRDLDWRASGFGPVTLRVASAKTDPPVE